MPWIVTDSRSSSRLYVGAEIVMEADMEAAGVGKQQGGEAGVAAMLDPDYMAMVLAMDTLWAADHGDAADEAS